MRKSWSNNFGNNFTDNIANSMRESYNFNEDMRQQYQADVTGEYGEFSFSTAVDGLKSLYGKDWHIIDNVLIQTGVKRRLYNGGDSDWEIKRGKDGRLYEIIKKSSQIDHVIVCRQGIFVIETKNYKGRIFGDDYGRVWTQIAHNGKYGTTGKEGHFTFFNPVKQNELHIKHLCNGIKVRQYNVTNMVVFTNPDVNLSNVNSRYTWTLEALYNAFRENRFNEFLSSTQVEEIVRRIDKIGSYSYLKGNEHINYVRDVNRRYRERRKK